MSRIVILSPHADDAIWSLGGAIPGLQSYGGVTVVTVFNAVPTDDALEVLAKLPAERWRYLPTSAIRQREDSKATFSVGSDVTCLPFVDAAIRLGKEGFRYLEISDLFGTIHPEDTGLVPLVQKGLQDILTGSDMIFAPLGLGGHVDHKIVREAAKGLPLDVTYYEEFPYAINGSDMEISRQAHEVSQNLKPYVLSCDLNIWQASASHYRSQVRRLFGNADMFKSQLSQYAHRYGAQPCCRIWSTASENLFADPSGASK